MRKQKFRKTGHKREELPSFLKNLQEIPNDIDISQKIRKNNAYLGPVFFGGDQCLQYHPPHQLAPLTSFHNVQYFAPLKENILKDIFQPLSITTKSKPESPEFRLTIRRERKFVDLYTHRCPGARKTFAPDPHIIEGLGKTVSKIEGETSREIPFYRVKKVISHCFVDEEAKPELEIVTLSDIREERIKFLPYKERIAHAHFPKEFATVEVIGPTIPASIIITKLPSKRQTSFEFDAHVTSNSKKTEGSNEETEHEIAEKPTEEGSNEETEHETAEKRTEEGETGAEEEEEKSKESTGSLATGGESPREASVHSDKRPSQESEEKSDRTQSKIFTEREDEEAEETTENEKTNASEVEEEAEDFQETVQQENSPEEAEE